MTNQTPKQFNSFITEVISAKAVAREEAMNASPFPKSRGMFIATADKQGQCPPMPEGEAIPWLGTKQELDTLVTSVLADYPQVTEVYVMGGYDGYETPADQLAGHSRGRVRRVYDEYDPSVSVWEVTYWTRQA